MSDLDLFRELDTRMRQAVQYNKWGQSNQTEKSKYETFADALKRGEQPSPLH